jgi:hypothetical protein
MWKKDKIYRLCGEAVSQHPDWGFLKGEGAFVNKKQKWLREKIFPGFRFWPQATIYQVNVAISLPALEKHVLSPIYDDKYNLTFVEPLTSIFNLNNIKESQFVNRGDIPTEEEVIAEMSRWITAAEAYFEEQWDITDEASVFECAKNKWDGTFRDSMGIKLCAFATAVGEFDFVEQHLTPDIVNTPSRVAGSNLLALLPELKQKWQSTGSIY